MELFKKYRPTTLGQIVGNTTEIAALKAKIDADNVPHAILISGPSGCGKTTTARIIKDELGCHDLDYREQNSASYRGIDSIRSVMEVMNLSAVGGGVRVWVFDEAHKLSNDAQNAMLKMLEDTPRHVYFILCTTEPEKIIAAVKSRCSTVNVRALEENELGALIDRVAKKEKINLDKEVRAELIVSSAGSARVGLVLLEKIAALSPAQQLEAVRVEAAKLNEAIDLCKALMYNAGWLKVAAILRNLKGEPEQTRHAVMGFARWELLKSGKWGAYNVIKCFEQNFFDSKAAGLAAACYEAVHAKE